MRVFVAGATGVLGRRVLPLLVGAGHDVTGMARSQEKSDIVRRLGAAPLEVDLFERPALEASVKGHDVVVNVATKIPPVSRAWSSRAWEENRRIRSEASRNLVDAALSAGAGRFVQESIAFIYRDCGDQWIDEDVPLDPPRLGRPSIDAEAQAQRFTETGRCGIVLRFGQFYAPDSHHVMYMCRMARNRLPALPGPASAYTAAISADDAARAVVAALEAPAGTWNVNDDVPLTRREFNRNVAEVVGAKPPLFTGTALMRLNESSRLYLRSQRVSNRRFKEATGWSPLHPDAASGWRDMAEELRANQPVK
ncbi:MAG TPA: NAD(P)-dependent oxidoreductase [Acidimicrobiales bacterium]|nr:NAD(P)-dependent oxidoreductase [Acidimicrobiales bacterium]